MSIWSSFVNDITHTLSSAELKSLEEMIPGWQALAQTSAGRATIQKAVSTINAEGKDVATGKNPLPALSNLSLSVSGFSGTNFAIRVVKVVIGGVLLISGIIHLAGIDREAMGAAGNFILPVKLAKTAAAVAE
jgi:hypothetical protein